MDSTSIIAQVSREDELLNTFPASEKGEQTALQVVSKMALKCWYAKGTCMHFFYMCVILTLFANDRWNLVDMWRSLVWLADLSQQIFSHELLRSRLKAGQGCRRRRCGVVGSDLSRFWDVKKSGGGGGGVIRLVDLDEMCSSSHLMLQRKTLLTLTLPNLIPDPQVRWHRSVFPTHARSTGNLTFHPNASPGSCCCAVLCRTKEVKECLGIVITPALS